MKERNYGIDIFKMFAMYLVCVLHVLGQGGVIYTVEPLSLNYAVSWSLELIAYVAVDCFALASGYVGYKTKFKPRRLINLWFTTVFYGLIITLLFAVTKATSIGFDDFKYAVFPFCYGNSAGYWYFTAYTVMFAFIPLFNYLINNISQKKFAYLVVVIIVLFCVIPAIKQSDYFFTANGYSWLWLASLYIIGSYIGKYCCFKRVKTRTLVFAIAICITISCAGHYLLNWYFVNYKMQDISTQADFLSNPYGNLLLKPGTFANYTFPTTLIISVLFLVLFSRIKVKKDYLKSKINSYVPLVFSVYLIHTNRLVFSGIMSGLFEGYAEFNPVLLVLAVLGTALAIFVICIMIDMLRFELFKLIKVDKLCLFIENKLRSFWNGVFEKKESEVV